MTEEAARVTQQQLYTELKDTRKEVLEAVGALSERMDRVSSRLDTFSEWKAEISGSVQSLHAVIIGIHDRKGADGKEPDAWRVWLVDRILPLGLGTLLGAITAHLIGG